MKELEKNFEISKISDKEFVEFLVDNETNFIALQKVFAELKQDKDSGYFRDDEEWFKVFPYTTLSYFYKENITESDWDFLSMILAFETGEYDLLACRKIDQNRAILEFYAHSYPYGGTGCMKALIESFGFKVVGEDNGLGYIEY